MDDIRNNTSEPPKATWALIALALFLPSAVTWVYFIALADAAAQGAASAIGKGVQFSLPVVWVFWICRQKPQWRWPEMTDLLLGFASGTAIALAMAGLYFFWMRHEPLFITAIEPIRNKVTGFGIDALWKYLALTVFYALVHSLLEEYYWRWFVFAQLRKLIPLTPAIVISSIAFAAHHVLVLGHYFGYMSVLTWLFSLGVAIGGVIWAWQFERTGRLWGIWLSHLLVDAAIFLIGLHLIGDLM